MIKEKLKTVPQKPGSYQMMDTYGNIIYVGKAKNLKNRLSSYFTGSHDYKTTKMLTHVVDFTYIVTSSELEAFILELDLIKKHQPRYNVLLTDDKTYPYIEITREKHPKLIVTRNVKKKHRNLFGPYTNVKAARETIKVLNKLYPLRQCGRLPDEPCLYYYLDQCLAPCIKPVQQETYRDIEKNIRDFLKGKTSHVVSELKEKMQTASDNWEFEKASEYKSMIDAITTTTTHEQAVNLNDMVDRDVIGVAHDDNHLAFAIVFVRNGKIAASDRKIMPYYSNVSQAVVEYLAQFYQNYPTPKEVFVPQDVNKDELGELIDATFHTPMRGVKRKILNIANTNAEDTLANEQAASQQEYDKTFGVLDALSEKLNVPTPYHIEAFDNSHTFGEYPVSSMVVFKNGRPSKQDYRKYRLDESQKQSGDTDQMREVLYRRYRRVLMDDLKWPDLIVIDGGIQQMNIAQNVLRELNMDIPFAGLVKNTKHKTSELIDMYGETKPIDPHSKLFQFLSHIQEEAHRFAITFHKDLREKGVYESVLDTIPGVGPKTKSKLLNHFKTIDAMKRASIDDFKGLNINEKTATNILNALKGDAHDH